MAIVPLESVSIIFLSGYSNFQFDLDLKLNARASMNPETIETVSSESLFPAELENRLAGDALLAVLTLHDESDAVPLARALVEGGITSMELAWRTPASLAALKAIVREVPEMLAGVGTILSREQLEAARDAGAAFGVSPGLSVNLLEAAGEMNFPYAPGIMSPSEIQIATEYGCRFLKFFPAESSGGINHLKNINAPFKHLNLHYIVLGGLSETNLPLYLSEPSVSVIGGSWIAAPDLIRNNDWNAIRDRAASARRIIRKARNG